VRQARKCNFASNGGDGSSKKGSDGERGANNVQQVGSEKGQLGMNSLTDWKMKK